MSEITKNGRRKIFLIAEIIEQNSNKPFLKTLKRKLRQREFASSPFHVVYALQNTFQNRSASLF